MIDSPVFRSVHQALSVSYLMAVMPPTQKSSMQVAIEKIKEMAGVSAAAISDSTINFDGLSPLEVRGQCAMVIAAVSHQLQPAERCAIEAWYAHDARKAEAVRFLRDWCAPHWTIESSSARTAIMWHVNLREEMAARNNCTLRAIEGEHQIPKSTVHDQAMKIRKAVQSLRNHGLSQLEWIFTSQGVVGEPA